MNEPLAKEIQDKLDAEEVRHQRKISALKAMDTKGLVDMLPELEDKLEEALRLDAGYRDLNQGYLSSRESDCREVKRILAELSNSMPSPDGKKPTAADRDAWLILQRTKNEELEAAINRQNSVSFELENDRISIEMAKKRLDGIHKVIGLKTAQIQFLTER